MLHENDHDDVSLYTKGDVFLIFLSYILGSLGIFAALVGAVIYLATKM